MEEKDSQLIIEENTLYEIDLNCMKKKRKEYGNISRKNQSGKYHPMQNHNLSRKQSQKQR